MKPGKFVMQESMAPKQMAQIGVNNVMLPNIPHLHNLLGHIHNQGTTFWPQDSRTLFLWFSKYKT